MKRVLSFIIVLALSCSLFLFVGCGNKGDGGDSKVEINGLTIENGVVTKYEPNSESGVELEIPEKAGKIYVTEIASEVFRDCKALKTIKLPSTINKIGQNAFRNCSNLEGVYIEDLGGWCGIEFNEKFANPINNPKCYKLYVNNELLEKIKIPSYITRIERYAFYMCTSIKEITIPASVNFIGKYAFSGVTTNLEKFVFEDVKNWVGGSSISYTALQRPYRDPTDTGWRTAIGCYIHFQQHDWIKG